MKRCIATLLTLLALPVWADLVASNGEGNELRLTAAKCTDVEIMEMVKPEYQAALLRGQAIVGTRVYRACWIDTNEGAYVVFFSDGTVQVYPVSMFDNKPGV